MVYRKEQATFAEYSFDASGMNLHRHESGEFREVVVFVHGLNGGGYKTWKEFPAYLFNGIAGPPVDVALIDYPSLVRRIREKGTPLDFTIRRLGQQLLDLERDYDDIFLIGHSLGGVIAESAGMSYLQHKMANQAAGITALAALYLMAAPRAGSGFALPALQNRIKEFRHLKRLSSESHKTDEFYSTYVESENAASVRKGKVLVPRYACVAGADRLVSEFSAGYSIPTTQKLLLAHGHTSLVKPVPGNDEQVRWLLEKMSDVKEVRRQVQRGDLHKRQHEVPVNAAPSTTIVTEFWGDTAGSPWEEIYNRARIAASTADLLIQDHRLELSSKVDFLISVSAAGSVLGQGSTEQAKVEEVHRRCTLDRRMGAGLSPVGADAEAAVMEIDRWIKTKNWLPGIYVEGASDIARLEQVIARWLQILVDRDPRRARRGRSDLDEIGDFTDPTERGF